MPVDIYFENGKQFHRVRISKAINGFRVDKKRKGIECPKEAEKIERKLEVQAERELQHLVAKGEIWSNLVAGWQQAVLKGDIFVREIGRETLDDYLSVLKTYASELEELHVKEIDKARTWRLLDRVEREASLSRRKKLRAAIDNVFKWAILSNRVEGLKDLPTEGYASLSKAEEKMPEILTEKEIRLLLKYAKELEHEWYPIWAVALFTGMRSGELFALEWSKVDFDQKLIYVHQNWTNKAGFGPTKGRYWRVIPISPQFLTFLKELKLKTGNEKFVLPHLWDWAQGRQAEILRGFCKSVGLPSVKFHALRACWATQLLKNGVSQGRIMKMGGWKDSKTMMIYIRLAGIEVEGGTDSLDFMASESEVMGKVVQLFTQE